MTILFRSLVPAVNVYTQMDPTLGHQTDVQYVVPYLLILAYLTLYRCLSQELLPMSSTHKPGPKFSFASLGMYNTDRIMAVFRFSPCRRPPVDYRPFSSLLSIVITTCYNCWIHGTLRISSPLYPMSLMFVTLCCVARLVRTQMLRGCE